MNNPYTSRGPLQDARMFFGRKFELNEIAIYLRGGQSVSIVGPRGIGKTSLLQHLMNPETMTVRGIGAENLFIYLDCEELSSSLQDEIITHFCTMIASIPLKMSLELEPGLEAAITKPAWSVFELVLRKLNQYGHRVVFILDGFEHLAMNPHVDVRFYNALRSAAGRLGLAFLTASTRSLVELTCIDSSKRILSSPFFNIFAQLYLDLLSESEAGSLIRVPMQAAGIPISSQLEEFIYGLVGGYPLALQIACFHAWNSPDDLHKIELLTKQELEAHFQYYWNNLSPAERDVVMHPAEAGLQEAGNPALAIVLRDLIRKCLLLQKGGAYMYPSNVWAEFVSAHLHDPVKTAPIGPPV